MRTPMRNSLVGSRLAAALVAGMLATFLARDGLGSPIRRSPAPGEKAEPRKKYPSDSDSAEAAVLPAGSAEAVLPAGSAEAVLPTGSGETAVLSAGSAAACPEGRSSPRGSAPVRKS